MPSVVQSEIIQQAIIKLAKKGITVRSSTCDGAKSNLKTLQLLGCNFNFNNFVNMDSMNIPCIIHPKEYKSNMKQHFHQEASTENIDLNVQNALCPKNEKQYSSHLQTAFQHPLSDSYIYSILDPSHMIKLCRNTFAECKITYENREISFAYVKKLHDIQE